MNRTRKAHVLFAGLVGCSITGAASAQLVVLSDDFNSYTNGTLVPQGGWTTTGTVFTTPVQVAGGADKYVQFGTSGEDDYKVFSSPVTLNPTDSLETRVDINVSAATATGDYFTHLSNPAGTTANFYQRVFARSSGAGFQLGLVDTSGTGSTTTWGTTVLAFNTAYSLKIVWNFLAGANNDTFTLDVNSVNYLNHTWTSTGIAEPTTLAAANLRQGGATTSATLQLDNLNITSVPGPGSVACLMSGMIIAGRRRRS